MLALEITAKYHSQEAAAAAKDEFDKVHANHELPSDMETFTCKGPVWVAKALVDAGLEPSTKQARRDLAQGAVKIDQEKVEDEQLQLEVGTYVLQVGKRKFVKLEVV